MKLLTCALILPLLLLPVIVRCQTYVYEKLYDNPDTGHAALYINLIAGNILLNSANNTGNSFNMGGSIVFSPSPKRWGIEAEFKKSVLLPGIGFSHANSWLQAGGFYNFITKPVRRMRPVVVNRYFKNTGTEIEEYIRIPIMRRKSYGVRAGWQREKRWEAENAANPSLPYTAGVWYAGLQIMRTVNFCIDVQKRDTRDVKNLHYKGWQTFYADVLITRTMQYEVSYVSPKPAGPGFRIGMCTMNPLTRFADKTRGLRSGLFIRYEVGYRPADGFFFAVSLVWSLVRVKI